MTRAIWTIIFVLAVAQASAFGYALNMNNRLGILEEEVKKHNPEIVMQSIQLMRNDIVQIINAVRGIMVQVQYLTIENEKQKPKKVKQIETNEIKMG